MWSKAAAVGNAFRQALSDMVGPPVMPRRTASLHPMSVKALAQSLPSRAFQNVSWREGINDTLSGRFAGRAGAPRWRQCGQGTSAP